MVYPKFDQGKYKKTFDSMYGAGTFDSSLSQARDIGRLKVQGEKAKTDYLAAVKLKQQAAKNKTYNDALSFWNDPTNKETVKKAGATRVANDILNDPNKQSEIEAQGFKVSDYIDAMYSAASDGKFRSQREYGQYQKELTQQTKQEQEKRDEEYKAKHGMDYETYSNYQKSIKQNTPTKSETSSKKGNGVSLWDDIIAVGKTAVS